MSLTIRKLAVLVMILGVFLVANALVLAHWLSEVGAIETAEQIREEFLTGTAITVIVAMLILLVAPGSQCRAWIGRRCPVCDHRQARGRYCAECGSRMGSG